MLRCFVDWKGKTDKGLSKKIIKFTLILVAVSVVYYFYVSLIEDSPISLFWILRYIYSNNNFSYAGCYWFLYAYIEFLLVLPLINILVKGITEEFVKLYYDIIIIFFLILPAVEVLLSKDIHLALRVPLFANSACLYPIVGYYGDKKEVLIKNIVVVNIISIVVVIANIINSYNSVKNGEFKQENLSFLILIISIAIFLDIKLVTKHVTQKVFVSFITKIGNFTFGVFLLHGFVMYAFDKYYLKGITWGLKKLFCYVFIIYGICIIISCVFSKMASLFCDKVNYFIKNTF